MSSIIDSRIVSMVFDNSQFNKNVEESEESLSRLNTALSKKNMATDGLVELTSALESMANRFNSLGTVAGKVLDNITTKIANVTTSTLKSLTIDQISSGWSKYNEKVASVQTMLNSTSMTMDEVNDKLSTLMWFSDETSYSFSQMSSALGSMLTTGGEVDKLIPMLEGMANATAFAGKGASEFSRVIYNLKQSYGQGYLSYMDWKSVEGAGVASTQLKEALIDAGKAAGTLYEKAGKIYTVASDTEVTVANMGTTLSDKWATQTVMESAFGKFAKYSQLAKDLIDAGYYDTATEAYGDIAEIAEANNNDLTSLYESAAKKIAEYATLTLDNGEIVDTEEEAIEYLKTYGTTLDSVALKAAKAAQEAKSMSEWLDASKDAMGSAFMRMFEAVIGNYEEAKEFWSDLTEDTYDLLIAPFSNLADMFESWNELGGRDYFVDTVEDIKDLFETILQPILDLLIGYSDEEEDILAGANKILDVTGKIHYLIFAIVQYIKVAYKYIIKEFITPLWNTLNEYIFDPILTTIATVTDAIDGFFARIRQELNGITNDNTASEIFGGTTELEMFGGTTELEMLGDMTELETLVFNVIRAFSKLRDIVQKIIEQVSKVFTNISPKFTVFLNNLEALAYQVLEPILDFITDIHNEFSTTADLAFFELLENILGGILDIVNALFDKLNQSGVVRSIIEFLITAVKVVGRTLNDLFTKLKDVGIFDSISEWFKNFKIKDISNIVVPALNNISGTLGDIIGLGWDILTTAISKIGKFLQIFTDIGLGGLLIVLIPKLSKAIQLVEKLVGIKVDDKSFTIDIGVLNNIGDSISSMFTKIGDTFATYAKDKQNTIDDILHLAEAIALVSLAFIVLGEMDSSKIDTATQAIATVVIALGALTGVLYLFNKIWNTKSKLTSNTSTSKGILGTIKDLVFGSKSSDGSSSNILSFSFDNFGKKILSIALSLVIVAGAFKILSTISWDEFWPALAGIGVCIITLVGIAVLMNALKIKKVPSGFVSLAFSILLMAVAFTLLAYLPDDLAYAVQALIFIGVFILAMVGISKLLKKNKSNFTALAAGTAVIGVSLLLIAGALAILEMLDPTTMLKNLAIVGLFVTFIILILGLCSAVGKGSGLNAILTAGAILLIAAALIVLAEALIMFQAISWSAFGAGIAKLALAFAALAVIMVIFSLVATAISAAVGPMLLVAAAMAALGLGAVFASAGAIALVIALDFLWQFIKKVAADILDLAFVVVETIATLFDGLLSFVSGGKWKTDITGWVDGIKQGFDEALTGDSEESALASLIDEFNSSKATDAAEESGESAGTSWWDSFTGSIEENAENDDLFSTDLSGVLSGNLLNYDTSGLSSLITEMQNEADDSTITIDAVVDLDDSSLSNLTSDTILSYGITDGFTNSLLGNISDLTNGKTENNTQNNEVTNTTNNTTNNTFNFNGGTLETNKQLAAFVDEQISSNANNSSKTQTTSNKKMFGFNSYLSNPFAD